MTAWRLVFRSLVRHWRANLSVALGVAAATAVLTGAMLVGDSMQASLRRLALGRLGRIDQVLLADRFFREELADELASGDGFREHFQDAVPVILLQTTLENPDSLRRAGRVTALGCDQRFWSLASDPSPNVPAIGEDEILLNAPVAEQLGVGKGQEVLLRVGGVSQIPADSPMGRKTETMRSRRLTVSEVIPAEGLACFSLQANQQKPAVAFVRPDTLQSMLERQGEVNAILVADKSADDKPSATGAAVLRRFLRPKRAAAGPKAPDASTVCGPTLADLGLSLQRVRVEHEGEAVIDYYSLTSDELLLPPAAEQAALEALKDYAPQPALTYLANSITAGGGKAEIPYSTVTAIDSTKEMGPLLLDGEPLLLGDHEIVLNSWAANDLEAQGVALHEGDEIKITYFEPESTHGKEQERTASLRLRAVLPLAAPGGRPAPINDRGLTPETPGLTDKQSIDNWDPPFPYDSARVRTRPPNDQDEAYWRQYQLTPKAFVSLTAGRRLWRSRFGQATSIRIPAPQSLAKNPSQEMLGAGLPTPPKPPTEGLPQRLGLGSPRTLSDKLRSVIEPERLGFSWIALKQNSLEAAKGTTSFSSLFLGFSFFIIAAAVMLVALLFRLGVEQRAAQIGLLLAVGLRRSRTGLLLASEGLVVAAAGGLLGAVLGVGYAWLMLAGLRLPGWWLAAVVAPFLRLHMAWGSLAVGFAAGVLVSVLTVAWTLRSMRRSSVRRLLAGQTEEPAGPGRRRGAWARVSAYVLLGIAAALACAAVMLSGETEAGAFFGCGAMVLVAGLLWAWAHLAGEAGGSAGAAPALGLTTLAIRSAGRNPVRSTLTIGLVASASFLIVAVSAFRLDPSPRGAGGFDLVAESNQPILHDLNSQDGRRRLGFEGDEAELLSDSTVLSFRVKDGDDASCLNLYKPRQPRVLGVPPAMEDRYAPAAAVAADRRRLEPVRFAWAENAATTPSEKENPWRLLNKTFDNGAVPVILDNNTAKYSMHLFQIRGAGTEFQVAHDDGRTIRYRIVALLSHSIFQGSLLIGESQFRRLFPEVSGYRYFLVQSAAGRSEATLEALERRLGDQGLDAEPIRKRLADLMAVQNTYLSTFQSLGGLGLLLGTFGLAAVQMRNVLERRGELALLRAAGFRRWRLAKMVMLEHVVLLAGGLFAGVAAALAAVLPHWIAGEASIPAADLAGMLLAVLVAGFVSGLAAVRSALRAPLLPALRGD